MTEARKIHDKAIFEFEHGKKYGNDLEIRDGAEKAWLATINAINAFLLSRGDEPPVGREAHQIRNEKLLEYARDDPRVENLFYIVTAIKDVLHGRCFYYGFCTPIESIEDMIKNKVKKIIKEVYEFLCYYISLENRFFMLYIIYLKITQRR